MFYISFFKVKRFFFLKMILVHSNFELDKKNLTPIKIKCPINNRNFLEKKQKRGEEKNKFAKQVNDFLK